MISPRFSLVVLPMIFSESRCTLFRIMGQAAHFLLANQAA
jgi:hypothetical protein